jgi:hypothetical protein
MTTEQSLISDNTAQNSSAEKVASLLGYAGLLPFIAFSFGSWLPFTMAHLSYTLLITYAAIILSFMGAVHWGAAIVNRDAISPEHFTASVIPALIAWMALLLPAMIATAVLLLSFILLYHYDTAAQSRLNFVNWYIPLRKRLTWIVSLCLTTSLTAQIVTQLQS